MALRRISVYPFQKHKLMLHRNGANIRLFFEIKNKKWKLSPVSIRQQTILLFRASIYREGLMEKELN